MSKRSSTAEARPALLTPGQAAHRAGVDPKTIARWADKGLLTATRTLGGHRRIDSDTLTAALALAGTTNKDQS